MSNQPVKKVVIVGGGTAGWMAAASISKLIGKNINVTLIESDAIGTVGVGEATIPTMITLHRLLKIDEREFMKTVQRLFNSGYRENWKNVNENYIHSFGLLAKIAGLQAFSILAKRQGAGYKFRVWRLLQ